MLDIFKTFCYIGQFLIVKNCVNSLIKRFKIKLFKFVDIIQLLNIISNLILFD